MMEIRKTIGIFVAFVLLSDSSWNVDKFITDLKELWNIDFSKAHRNENTLVESYGDGYVGVTFVSSPIPGQEAEQCAALNYMWPEATDIVKSHKAHIIITVTGDETGVIENAKMITKIADACLKQENAIAVYSDGMVHHPAYYGFIAQCMKDGELPILDWVWLGIAKSGDIPGIYTYGLRKFGKEEIEVYADAEFKDVRNFVLNMVDYVLSNDATLNDGDTIGFSDDQRLPVSLSKGIAIDGQTIKIQYPKE